MAELPDRFLFEIEGVSTTLRVARFTGHEALSELFRFEILFATEEEIDVASAIGAKALLTTPSARPGGREGFTNLFVADG